MGPRAAGIIARMQQSFRLTRRPRSDASERTRWSQRYRQSGLSQRDFARQHSLGLSTLQRWLRQNPAPDAPPLFAELKWPAASARWAAEVVRADGLVVRLAAEVPRALLEQLLPPC